MKLTKKHIGQCFDNWGSDGSWFYTLVDVKGKKLLFLAGNESRFEIDSNKYSDWQVYVPRPWKTPTKKEIKQAWATARDSSV